MKTFKEIMEESIHHANCHVPMNWKQQELQQQMQQVGQRLGLSQLSQLQQQIQQLNTLPPFLGGFFGGGC